MSKLARPLIVSVGTADEAMNLLRGVSQGQYQGRTKDGKPIPENERYQKCDSCGGIVDISDLANVFNHAGPLPHPTEDKPQ